jgi:YgiT-type zinc finger domain-containing protein
MTGELVKNSRCPLCGGRMKRGVATIPFILGNTVIVVKDVPAEICSSCHEPYMTGKVTNRITILLNRPRSFPAEVSIVSYLQLEDVPALSAAVSIC